MSVKSLLNKGEVWCLYQEHRSLRVVSRVLSERGQVSPRTCKPYSAMALHLILKSLPQYQEMMLMRRATKREQPEFKGKKVRLRRVDLGTPC